MVCFDCKSFSNLIHEQLGNEFFSISSVEPIRNIEKPIVKFHFSI